MVFIQQVRAQSLVFGQQLGQYFDLSDERGQRRLAVALSIFLGCGSFLSLCIGIGSVEWKKDQAMYGSSHRPFDLYDAEMLCQDQVSERFGDTLVRQYVDDHSTRVDHAKGIYRVFIQADVGDYRQYQEVTVHCFVDRWEKELSYFRKFDNSVKEVLSTDIKFFGN